MGRRTVEDTRQLLLDVGIRMLFERGANGGVTHVKLSEVAAAADLTTGAAYRCWDNQEAFHSDLATAAVRWRDAEPNAATVSRITSLVEARAPLAEVIRVAAEENLFRYPDDTAFLTTIALRACGPTDETLAEAGRARLSTAIESYSVMYSALMRLYGLRARPPHTVTEMALCLAALSEGFALQAMSGAPHPRVVRDDVPPDVDPDWTLFGIGVEAIVDRFTEPAEPGTESSADDGPRVAATGPRRGGHRASPGPVIGSTLPPTHLGG
jgi:AcrR family transcriptional regulator